jgi:lipopolysaccharide transport system ATP-binding protein
MKPILEIKNISKKFRIRHEHAPYLNLRDSFSSFFKKGGRSTSEEFWALHDVSFDVYPGESIGIIGKNGAGKSTLLKILSKITPPSSGKITLRGRIASLLEVGTGFHPELTGRENISLNGSILGMKRKEIQKKFDEIVDFSGVEKFLDTPLKHYSSGMQLRLAFAVAAFLEPEILLIDEVLAVGDAEFQKKCLGKMENVTRNEGRTVLFVSHNLAYVQSLCPKSVLLVDGRKKHYDNTQTIIREYLHHDKTGDGLIDLARIPRMGIKSKDFHIESLKIRGSNGEVIYENDFINLELVFRSETPLKGVQIGFAVTDDLNNLLIENRSSETIPHFDIQETGTYRTTVRFNPNLKEGLYSLQLGARSSHGQLEYLPSIAQMEICSKKDQSLLWDKTRGVIHVSAEWQINKL